MLVCDIHEIIYSPWCGLQFLGQKIASIFKNIFKTLQYMSRRFQFLI